jgi:hypothetical protein
MRECKGAGQAHTARDRRDCSRISGTLRQDISTHSGRCLLFSCAAYKSEFVSAAAQSKKLTFSLTPSEFRTRCFEGERKEIGWVRRGAGRLVRGGMRGGGVGRRRPLNGFEYQIEGVFINGVELEHSVLLPLFALCSHEACIASYTRTHTHIHTHGPPYTGMRTYTRYAPCLLRILLQPTLQCGSGYQRYRLHAHAHGGTRVTTPRWDSPPKATHTRAPPTGAPAWRDHPPSIPPPSL